MPRPYDRGVRMEYQACEELKAQGYHAQRTAGSHSPFDIVAWNGWGIAFIQVKRVEGPSQVIRAIEEAREAWEDQDWPHIFEVAREVWVRCQGKWHTFRLD